MIKFHSVSKAAFLAYHGVEVELELTPENRVAFSVPRTDEVLRICDLLSDDAPVGVRTFINTVDKIRSRMIALKGQDRLKSEQTRREAASLFVSQNRQAGERG